ncbi:non-ribosomal peptide synthetase [Delftia sp. ASV31]|uniref:non-ribosomal peptide synthetase n=1 Tax=Delftia sp. ASV31 TaxID=2795113 RepID=UPI0018EC82A2|nr:non-ribosomal peptide synthetase [Delftia sp. ASV31]
MKSASDRASDLLARLAQLGVTVQGEGGDLKVRGPAGAIGGQMRDELRALKPQLLALLSRSAPAPVAAGAAAEVDPDRVPLSFNQRRLWFLDRLEGGGSAFIMAACFELEGPLDLEALQQALTVLVERHELLRSVIVDEAAEPVLRIGAATAVRLQPESVDDASPQGLAELMAQQARQPFDLTQAPPLRLRLFALEPQRHVLALSLHHIAGDFWSMGLLLAELGQLYGAACQGLPSPLQPLPLRYPDYSAWQRATLDEARLAPQLAFWQAQLQGAPTQLAMPLDRPRPAERGASGAHHHFRISPEGTQALQEASARAGVTPFMALLAAYAAVLGRWTGQDEVVIGCPVAHRDTPQTQGLVGFFIDTLPLRIDLRDDPQPAELLQRVRRTCLQAFEHQDLPFERIVQAVRPERALNRAPLFQTMFVQQTAGAAVLAMQGLAVRPLPVPAAAPELDLNLSARLDGEAFACDMEYDADLFDPATVAALCAQFAHVAGQWACGLALSRLALAPQACAVAPAPAMAEGAAPASVPALIARAADRWPQRMAVQADGAALSLRELVCQADALAGRLRGAGARPGDLIGLGLGNCLALPVAMLAAWRCGCAYAVLSLARPLAQRATMMEAAGVRLVITASAAEQWPSHTVLVAPDLAPDLVAEPAGSAAQQSWLADPAQRAYVCFTSGSTGAPKGVVVSHANLAHHAAAVAREFGLCETDRVLQFAAPDFDVAAEEIFPTLASGACVVLRAQNSLDSLEAFHAQVAGARLTVLNLPSAFWHEWVGMLHASGTAVPPDLRLVVTGSDRVFVRSLRQWQALCRHPVALLSGYGPTEATISAAFFDPAHDVLPLAAEILPLGHALQGVQLAVVDSAGQALPAGAIGEIVIGGGGVAQGYLQQDEATQAAFRACAALGGARAYWSGDLARRRADGALEFLGRRDTQVKIRGFRIEPAEVEAALMAHPCVREAAVVLAHDGAGQPVLLAVVAGQADAAALRSWLSERLAPYMVPAVCRVLESLPHTASGKIDRRALAGLALQSPPQLPVADGTAQPCSPLEATLARLFAEVMNLAQVGVTDNVFDLGVDSIRCLQIVSRARRQGLDLVVRDIFRTQTVRALAGEIALRSRAAPTVPVAEAGAPLSPTPIQAWFLEHAGSGAAHYNQAAVLRVPPQLPAETLERALAGVVACHEMLRLRVDAQGVLDIAPMAPGPVLDVVCLEGLAPAEAQQRRAEAFAAAQRAIDPASGRMVRGVLLPGSGRLMLAIHHLAVDAYSWSVLLEDLALACAQVSRGEPVRLPAPTSSYARWSHRLGELAAGPEAAAQAQALQQAFSQVGATVLPPQTPAGCVGQAQTLAFELDEETTQALVHEVPRAFAARVDEALLAALVVAGVRLGVHGPWRVDLERNGRADLFEELDLSRTVGWFTALQRVGIEPAHGAADAVAVVAQVAAQVRGAAWQGLALGLLRYRSPDGAVRAGLAALPEPELLLNYLGRMDGAPAGDEIIAPVDEAAGPAQAPGLARSHVIELNAGLWNSRLRGELSFPAGEPNRERIAQWLDEVKAVLAEIAGAAREGRGACAAPAGQVPQAVPRSRAPVAVLALTPLQHGLLYHSLRAPDDQVYFDQLTLTLQGPLDPAALRRAWEAVVARHGVLRTSFHWDDGEAMQHVHAHVELPWQHDDWRTMDTAAQHAALSALLAQDRARGFDLRHAPLMRLHLLHTAEDRHELLWSAHHLLLDGWSVSVVMDEVFRLYGQALGDGTPALPRAPDFADCVRWHQRRDVQADQAFWRQALQGLHEPTSLAFLRQAGEPVEPEAPDPIEFLLPPATSSALAALARAARATPGIVLQAAWALLLSCHSGSRDLVFGVTVSGRSPDIADVEQMVGMLIATVPARVHVAAGMPLLSWLSALQQDHLEREQHAAASLAEIRQASELEPGCDLFQSLVLVQNYPAPDALQAGGLRLAAVASHERTNFLLTLACMQGADGWRLALHRDREQVPAAAARRLLSHLDALLAAMAAQPGQALGSLLQLAPEQARDALEAGTGPVETMDERFLVDWIDHWAQHTPGATALEGPHGRMDYAQLAMLSRQAACSLSALGAGQETRVALCLGRSPVCLAAIAAILRAGAAFVPIDPALPAQRQRFMLEDSGAVLVLADAALPVAQELGLRCLTPEQLFGTMSPDEAAEATVLAQPQASSSAYVIYTSGSTGTPKGVVNTRAGMRALAHAQQRVFALDGSDRVLQFASLSFDASIWEMTMAWRHGAALLVPAPDMARAGPQLQAFVRRHGITAATLPPTVLSTLDAASLDALRLLVVAGEACAPELALRWSVGRRFFNAYGPTEASVAVSVQEGVQRADRLPIGRPLPNMQLHVLDEDMRLLPPGAPGELYIGGAGLARGYLGRPGLTAASFVQDPFGDPGERLYRTGDRGWRLADGRVHFAGRNDHQVKLRGLRIELGEIEAALATHPGVEAAAVLVIAHGEADHRLTAFVGAAHPVGAEALRAYLAARLPAHMVPAYFVELNQLPLTHSGKIDRQALGRQLAAQPARPSSPAPAADAAAGDACARLAAVWAQVLGVAEVGPHQSFFELGGDSILAIQVVARANRQGLAITLAQLMDPASQTVAALVALLGQDGGPVAQPCATEDVAGDGRVPLMPIQRWFLALEAPQRQHYNQSFLLTVPADLAPERLQAALALLLQRHDALRLRYRREDGGWVQTLADGLVPPAVPLLQVVASPPGETPAAWRERLQAAAVANQERLDLQAGPLMHAALYLPPGQEEAPTHAQAQARLHLVVHHLAIDAVSWRVLLDDLAEACRLGRIARPPGASFSHWAAAVSRHAASQSARAELPYWLAQSGDACLPLARGAGAASTVGEAVTLGVQLSVDETGALLREAPRVHGASMQELLLAALASALAGRVQGRCIGVALESHGRDVVLEGLEVGSTVGWFTALAPLALPLPRSLPDAPPADGAAGPSALSALAVVREALRAMPRRGFGYGVLSQLSPEPAVRQALAAQAPPGIAFNYLGQWDTAWPEGEGLRPAPERDGPGFAASTPRAFPLEVNAMVADGRLALDLTYDPRDLEEGWIAALAADMQAWLVHAAASARQAGSVQAGGAQASPSLRAPALPSHGLGPQQGAMLAHALACPGSSAYVVQLGASLPATLDVPAFMAAWNAAVARHAALRACFSVDAADGSGRQHVDDSLTAAPWRTEDWSAWAPADAQVAYDALLEIEQARGFDLASAPLMRFALARMPDGGWRFCWTYHHLLVDGWSMPILMADVQAVYAGRLPGAAAPDTPAPDVRRFLDWLDAQDARSAQAFWKNELAGLAPSRWPAAEAAVASGRSRQVHRVLAAGTGASVAAFARRHRLSVPSVALLAWALVLARHMGRDDLAFGVTSALRPAELEGAEAMVGAMLATPPLRVRLDRAQGFAAACQQLQRWRMQASGHAWLAPRAIASAAGLAAADDLFGTALRIQNYPLGELGNDSAALTFHDVDIRDAWHHPFNLEVMPGDDFRLLAVHDALKVAPAVADALLESMARLLETLDQDRPLTYWLEETHG